MTSVAFSRLCATVLAMLVIVPASAQVGIRFEPREIVLEPGQGFKAADIGSIADHHLLPGVYSLKYRQEGDVALQNLELSTGGRNLDSGDLFLFSSTMPFGLSFSIGDDASPGDSTIVAELYDDKHRFIGSDTFEVRVRFKSASCLACFRAWDERSHIASEADILSVNADRPWCLDFEVHQVIDIDGNGLRSGDAVAVQAWHGRYWSAQPNGALLADRSALQSWETFELHKVGGSAGSIITRGDRIALEGAHDRWIVAEGGGGEELAADRIFQSTWETFTFLPAVKLDVCLRAHDSSFVAPNAGDHGVSADRTSCRDRARHELIDANGGGLRSGDVVYLRSKNDRFWSAQPGGELHANRLNAGPWERFRLIKRPGFAGQPIQSGDEVALLTNHGKWVVAEGGGGGEMAANRDQALSWETFTLLLSSTTTSESSCGTLAPATVPFAAGCVGECRHEVFESSIQITSSGLATGCRGACDLELTVLDTMCPTDFARVELLRNGVLFATQDVRGFLHPLPQLVFIKAGLQADDLLTVRVTDIFDGGPGVVCKRLGDFRFEVSLVK